MSSNYDALSGGVSAFGGLGRDFGRVGRLGSLGTAQQPPAGSEFVTAVNTSGTTEFVTAINTSGATERVTAVRAS